MEMLSEISVRLTRDIELLLEEDSAQKLWASPHNTRVFALTHVLNLLAPADELSWGEAVSQTGTITAALHLVIHTSNCLKLVPDEIGSLKSTFATPVWLALLLLLVDMSDKVSMAADVRRRKFSGGFVWEYLKPGTRHQSHWREEDKWAAYDANINQDIEAAFMRGDGLVVVSDPIVPGEIDFTTMIQRVPGNRQLLVRRQKTAEPAQQAETAALVTSSLFGGTASADMLRACADLLSLRLDPDTLNATLRLTVRLTRQNANALAFVEQGGLLSIMGVCQGSTFKGFTMLVMLIIRHIIEDDQALQRVMRSQLDAYLGSIRSPNKHLRTIVQGLAPLVTRNPDMFVEEATHSLVISEPYSRKDVHAGPLSIALDPSRPVQPSYISPGLEQVCRQLVLHVFGRLGSAVKAGDAEAEQGTNRDGAFFIRPVKGPKEPATPPEEDESWYLQVFSVHKLLGTLIELTQTYPSCGVVLSRAEGTYNGHSMSFFALLLHEIVLDGDHDPNSTKYTAQVAKSNAENATKLLSVLASAGNAKIQLKIIQDIKAALVRTAKNPQTKLRSPQATKLADLILSILPKNKFQEMAAIAKLMINEGIHSELVNLVTDCDLNDPTLHEVVECIFRPLDLITRAGILTTTAEPSKVRYGHTSRVLLP